MRQLFIFLLPKTVGALWSSDKSAVLISSHLFPPQFVHENRVLKRANESIKRLDQDRPNVHAVSSVTRHLQTIWCSSHVGMGGGGGGSSHVTVYCKPCWYGRRRRG